MPAFRKVYDVQMRTIFEIKFLNGNNRDEFSKLNKVMRAAQGKVNDHWPLMQIRSRGRERQNGLITHSCLSN